MLLLKSFEISKLDWFSETVENRSGVVIWEHLDVDAIGILNGRGLTATFDDIGLPTAIFGFCIVLGKFKLTDKIAKTATINMSNLKESN
jgi:hypothetical protein